MTDKEQLLASTASALPAEQARNTAGCGRGGAAGPQFGQEPLYLPFKRAVSISGLGRSTLYREAMHGRLRMVKAGRSTLVDYASLRALLDGLPTAQLTNAA